MTQTTDLQDITAALIVVACLRIFLRHMEARAAFYLSHFMYPHNMGHISEQSRVLLLVDIYFQRERWQHQGWRKCSK